MKKHLINKRVERIIRKLGRVMAEPNQPVYVAFLWADIIQKALEREVQLDRKKEI